MSGNNRQEPLQPFPTCFNDLVREAVGEDLARERRDIDASGFALKDVSERLEIRVASSDKRVAELEGRNVGL